MSVIVNDNMPIELALRLLWREATREGIIQKSQDNRYFMSRTVKAHEVKRKYAKTKRRRRAASRKVRSKNA